MATEGGRTLSPAPQRPSHRIQCCAFSGTQIVANAESPSSATACNLTEQVIDTALALAEEKGSWSAVRLHDVAERLSVQTPQILDHYRDLDAVADAWFLRGLKAMVGPKPGDFMDYPEWRRIEICLLA